MKEANDSREITTEISAAKPFYYAEDEHQQYLYKTRMATVVWVALGYVCRHSFNIVESPLHD